MDSYGRCPFGFHHRMSLAPAVDLHKNVASWPGVMLCLVLSTLWQGKRGCLQTETISRLSLNFRPFLAEWKTFFDSHHNQKALKKQHHTQYIMRNCKKIFINESSKPEVNVETYCQWAYRIFLRYVLWLIWSLSGCLQVCLDSRFSSLLKPLANASSSLHILQTLCFLHCPCTNQDTRCICGNISLLTKEILGSKQILQTVAIYQYTRLQQKITIFIRSINKNQYKLIRKAQAFFKIKG